MKVSSTQISSTVTMKTTDKPKASEPSQWWNAPSKKQLAQELLSTATYLKENQGYRQRQAALFARLYGNQSLFSFAGTNIAKLDQTHSLPVDRPTFNVVQSAIDTLISRISQSRPSPVFLTDNGDYKERNLAKKLNNFIQGEFYSAKIYDKGAIILRDALVEGTGCIHVFENASNRADAERVLLTELFTDANESIYGEPRQLYRVKLVDRDVLAATFPGYNSIIESAEQAYPDNSNDSSRTVADQIIVVEGWHLPSGKDTGDGRHTLACSSGVIFDEKWTKDKFPFAFLHYSPRLLGFWAQGLAEQLMGTQLEINQLLFTISKAIKLVGVPRVFQEMGSKVIRSHHNNDVGVIIEYRGTKPSYEVAPCVPQEMYAQLERLIQFGYQQSGVSSLDASAQKPQGLNSGEAIRTYDDISTDRFASLSRRYDSLFIDVAYLMIDLAKEIAERDGEYSTVYPGKNGARQINLPDASLLQKPFIIQCFNQSSLPRDPAGRKQTVVEMIQAGMISIKEGRRLLDFPDLGQAETLANASEERIYCILDRIVEDGDYEPADSFLDLALAKDITVQYINLYATCKLEDDKMDMLRDFYTSILALIQSTQPPAGPPQAPGAPNAPQANPEPAPTSPMLPNAPQTA